MNWSALLVGDVPYGVVTVTSTVRPNGTAGAVAAIEVPEVTVKVAGKPPKETAVAPVKVVPVMVTAVPPTAGPELGLTEATLGGGT